MQFEKTQTFQNLARSFAGECQAGMRYQFVAQLAEKEGKIALKNLIKTIAKNETAHAKAFFDKMHEHASGQIGKVEFTADFPYSAGSLEEGLRFSAIAEDEEAERVYPAFRDKAREEGYEDIALLYERIIKVEQSHRQTFDALFEDVRAKTLYKAEKPRTWKCSNCGNEGEGKTAWATCPLCGMKQGYVEIPVQSEEEA